MNLLLSTFRFLESNTNHSEELAKLAFIIAGICFLVPIVVLSIIVVIKKIIKIARKTKKPAKPNLSKDAFLALFGKDNVLSVDTVMTRVIVEVKDVDLVNFEELKKLNIGILITGNVVKCSSEEYANLFR